MLLKHFGTRQLRKCSIFLLLTALWSTMPQAAKGKDASLFEPTFTFVNGGTSSAGQAWCAKLSSGKVVAVTALHLLGPDGGLPAKIPASKAAGVVKRVDFRNVAGANQFSSVRVLTKSGYIDERGLDHSGDLLFFEAHPELASRAFILAEKLPRMKEPVWVYTSVAGGQPQAYPAVVTGASTKMLTVQLYKPIALQACSGSPVLDKQGKVVGLLTAAYESQGVLMCNQSTSILTRLRSDLKSAK